MKQTYSLPTLDIGPLRNVCLADTGLKLPPTFIDDVIELEKCGKWIHSKFAHREYKENRGYPDPNDLEKKDIDYKIIVRQLKSSIKQEIMFGEFGNINNKSNPISRVLCEKLGDNSKYFSDLLMLKFDSNHGFLPHKDGGGYSRLYIPIYPFGEDYSRLEFYYDNQIYYLYNYISPPPVYLFSSSTIHAVFNQGYPTRLNLQVVCELPYDEAIALFNEN